MWYIYIYIYVPYVHNLEVLGRFDGLDLKKGNGHFGRQAMEVARLVNNEENDWNLKSKGKNTGYTCNLHDQ